MVCVERRGVETEEIGVALAALLIHNSLSNAFNA